jgi:uncharacterized membrane protein YdbT with pleckstrin-like domain
MITLLENEHIVKVVRKHWLFIAGEIFGVFIASVAPLFFVLVIEFLPFKSFIGNLESNALTNVLTFFYFSWLLIWWVSAFSMWTDYYLDEWVVTNQRIVTIEQKGLFEREIGSLRLDTIQNVSVEIPGLIATMFKIGNLQVETAGERTVFIIRNVSSAEECKQTISHLCKDATDQFKMSNIVENVAEQISQKENK